MIADSDGIAIEWEEQGSGDPVLLVHGLGYARWGWEPLIPSLAEHFRVITFDNRGIGGSSVPPGPYSATEMATDALAVLDAAGVSSAHIVGTSLGGMIAQEIAIEHASRVRRLVLICTTPGSPLANPIPDATLQLIAEAPSLPPEVSLRKFVINALGVEPDPGLVETIFGYRMANPPDPIGWGAQAIAGASYSGGDRARQIDAATLLIAGTGDRVVDHRNSEILHAMIPDATLTLVRDAGHLVFWEHPHLVATTIIDFLL